MGGGKLFSMRVSAQILMNHRSTIYDTTLVPMNIFTILWVKPD